jgi:hypothetical protein
MKRSSSCIRCAAAAALLVLCVPLSAQQTPSYVSTATDLKRDPSRSAETLEALAPNTPVTSLKRQGSWVQVQHGENVGWVRMLVVRSGTPGAQRKGEGGLSKLFNIARSGSSGAVTTTGVRGLDKEQIKNATPNPAELAKIDGWVANDDQARKLAAAKPGLKAANVAYVKSDGSAEEAQP